MKRTIAFILSLVLVLSFPVSAFAETYEVGTAEEMSSSWEAANTGPDTSNTFNMTANIDMGGVGNQLHAQSGNSYTINGNGYELSTVNISAFDSTVVGSSVTINADISASNLKYSLDVHGNVNVTVNGDVSNGRADSNPTYEELADGTVLSSNGAEITINGDINAQGNEGIVVHSGCSVEVNGDVHGDISAGDSSVNVSGNVYGNESSSNYYYYNVDSGSGSSVYIGGDVVGNVGVTIHSHARIDGDVTGINENDREYGLPALTVGDDSTDTSTAIIGGSVTSDSAAPAVRVTANASGGNNLYVMGDVVSNYTGPDAPDGNAIEAGGSSLTEIAGSVKGDITIKDSAMVVVHDGSSDNNTPQAESSGTQYFFPVDKGAAPSAEFTDEQLRLLELCKSYGPTSMLDKTVYSIFNVSSDMQEIFDARVSISDMYIAELSRALEEVKVTALQLSQYSDAEASFLSENVHPQTLAAYRDKKFVYNLYGLELVKAQLAEALDTVGSKNAFERTVDGLSLFSEGTEAFRDYVDLMTSDHSGLNKILEASKGSPDEIVKWMLKNLDSETLEKIGSKDLKVYANKLKDIGDIISFVQTASTVLDVSTAVGEIVSFYFDEFSTEVDVLDHMLVNCPLDPMMYMATLELRNDYTSKFQKAYRDVIGHGIDGIFSALFTRYLPDMDMLKDSSGVLADVLGLSKKSDAILEGATSVELLYNVKAALEQAIKNVKYGDVSPESIEMVQVMFTVYKETAQSIGEAVEVLGNKAEREYAEKFLEQLEDLELGEVMFLSDPPTGYAGGR